MKFMPICLNVENSRIVVVGGGRIVEQKLRIVLQYTRDIVVCTPEISPAIRPHWVKVKEPIIHQPLITETSGRMAPLPKGLDLSYFSAVIFSSPAEVDAFEAVYGELPDHLLCYATDDRTRRALEKRRINCWRIVSCPLRGKIAENMHRVA